MKNNETTQYLQIFFLVDTVIQSFQCHFGTDWNNHRI